MSPEFIQFRLCWLGASYRLYLQDTSVIQSKHISALNKASNEVIQLLGKIARSFQMTCPSMKRWESIILKINKSATLPFLFYFYFIFLFLHACVTLRRCRFTRQVALPRSLCLHTFGSKRRACLFGGLARARTLGESKTILFLDPT